MECLTTKHYKYMDLEKRYHMIYPESSNATYTSLLNYSDDLNKPFQRWYRYKEGFSTEMVEQLIREYSIHKKGVILDPFSGSGSTLLAAAYMGYQGVGFEVNPFSCFLSRCKLESCSGEEREQFREAYERILEQASETEQEYVLPGLSISHKVFEKQVEAYFMRAGQLMETDLNLTEKVRNLLKLGWLSCLEPLSHYRKAGNGLKIKKYVKPRVVTPEDARNMLLEEYRKIYADLQEHSQQGKTKLYQDSCLNMNRYLEEKSVEGIIFSPPYANCFDYTEIYKLELWFGKFVSDYGDLKRLRNQSLHSHLNGDLSPEPEPESEILEELLEELKDRKLWDKKIPRMLRLYYRDMFQVLRESCRVLDEDGFCCIVVGNSAYGGVVFPADLILAEYGERTGFAVDKIEVDRYIITSSQQYEKTKETGKYLRESVVCLRKNK